MTKKVYLCIDLKSFYASVECVERHLNPLTTNLVVADPSRTQKTICLAVSPSLKKYGIPGRARLFEVIQKVKEINKERIRKIPNKRFVGKSFNAIKLKDRLNYEVNFIIAPPRMAYYMKYSTQIYNIYLKYVAPEDIFAYSIDEVFCDITNYLKYYNCNAYELATKMINDVYDTCGITATAGIGTNLYLSKIAMDIVAKHCEPNERGVRLASLDEMSYRRLLWNHQPITDFWRVGKGYAEKLKKYNILTMGDIALCSIKNEDLLYDLFGVNAELLIDHAWGWEPCTIKDIKEFKPSTNSMGTSQVLQNAYEYDKALLVIREMADNLSLDLVKKNLKTKQIVINIIYDHENLNDQLRLAFINGTTLDHYGREIPKPSHGTYNLQDYTSSSTKLIEAASRLFNRIVNSQLLIRKLSITATNVLNKDKIVPKKNVEQLNLFTDYDTINKKNKIDVQKEKEAEALQNTLLNIKEKYGKNAILKGTNLEDGSTAIERNQQIGGHHS